jgi:hypothetical protein
MVTALGGEEMAYRIAGGTKWWQVRLTAGVEAEWICMKNEYRHSKNEEKSWKKRVHDDDEGDSGCELRTTWPTDDPSPARNGPLEMHALQ